MTAAAPSRWSMRTSDLTPLPVVLAQVQFLLGYLGGSAEKLTGAEREQLAEACAYTAALLKGRDELERARRR